MASVRGKASCISQGILELPSLKRLLDDHILSPVNQDGWGATPYGERIVLGNSHLIVELISEFEIGLITICPPEKNEWIPLEYALAAIGLLANQSSAKGFTVVAAIDLLNAHFRGLLGLVADRERWIQLVAERRQNGFLITRNTVRDDR